jgi:TonB family protein
MFSLRRDAVETIPKRQGILVSALVHVIMITLLIRTVTAPTAAPRPASPPTPPRPDRVVVLPPAAELRRLLPAPPRRPAALRPPAPAPMPTPPPREAKDRISIGPPSTARARELILERDKDLSSAPAAAGRPGLPATPPPSPAAEAAELAAADPASVATPPPATTGRGQAPLVAPRPGERSITGSLRSLEERLGQMGAGGLSGAAGQQMGSFFFDPEGADFTAWMNHFKNEVYRNWIVPQGALMGVSRGHVDFEFTIQRDGSLSTLRMLKSSGTSALDRAAANALTGARALPLPSDFRPSSVTMQVSFYYGEGPRG